MNNKTTVTAEPGSSFLVIEREFNAPRAKVFAVYTEAEKLEKWWSPWGKANIEIDARDGGTWKFSNPQEDGNLMTFYGYFHEVTAPERIVQTEEFANLGERGHVALDKYDFIELDDNRTKVVLTMAFTSVSDRDATVQSGMEQGVVQQYINLETLLEEA